MAEIETSILRIGSNDLILQDAEARAKINEAYVTDTASGSIASFPDGADGVPVKSLKVNIEPVQDLHGQDAPYPAGGGKNLLPIQSGNRSLNGVTFTIKDDGTILTSGTSTASITFEIGAYDLASGNYVLSGCPSGGSTSTYYMDCRSDSNGQLIDNGNGVSFSSNGQSGKKARIIIGNGVNVNNFVWRPMIRLASESADFAPYENICPISGHTQAVLTRTGVNVWDEEWELGTIDGNGNNYNANDRIRSKNYVHVPTGNVYVKSPIGLYVWSYDANKTYLGRLPSNGNPTSNGILTIPESVSFIRFTVMPSYGTTYNHDISINYPSTDTDYHEGHVQTVTIDLGGTRYGGTLDVTTGVLTVDRAFIASYNGETLPSTWISDRDVYAAGTTPTTGAQVCYKLATPFTVQLTANQISTVLGQNNIWSDAGDTDVTYRADTKLYIEKLTAPTEDDMIADHAISANSFFMVGNTLYRATTAIASGATITVGTNATKLSLSDALNALA